MTRVSVNPLIIQWAIERSGYDIEELLPRFSKLNEWLIGDINPTVKQLENFAKAVHIPVGYLFFDQPLHEEIPIPDFRTFDGHAVQRPSPNLLDTIYSCQERQSWYREFAQIVRQPERDFIGSVEQTMPIEDVAANIRETIKFDLNARANCRTWEEALRQFILQADLSGILVMVSGIVHSNTRRKLDPHEFRGFALSDSLAPLVFINGADSKSAQMFTLAHELAHLWLNETGVSNASVSPLRGFNRTEVWCNAVAAELLVPLRSFRNSLNNNEETETAVRRLSRQYKVSTLVILRRLLDAEWFSRRAFDVAWEDELDRLRALAERGGGGGNFYRATVSRVSRRFTKAIVTSTLEGQTLYRDAYRMLGVKRNESFNQLGREVGALL